MDLITRIERALGRPGLDHREFERCACALLQVIYPGLSSVEGGTDFGRDADVYFTIHSPSVDISRVGRLMATTGDPRANVASGLTSMAAKGMSADLLVVATSQRLSATKRAGIENLAAEHGIATTAFFSQEWFVGQLWKNPVWRKRLLDIGGELGALTRKPLSLLRQAIPDADMVGREDDFASLGELLDGGCDILLVGLPGVGKTRVCAEFGEGMAFIERADEERLLDDLREQQPRVVVLDDAHDEVDVLRLVQAAREVESLGFSIIAITWPDEAENVQAELPAAQRFDLKPLARAHLDVLIQAQGVTGYRARRLVLDQAHGRAGWALALSAALLRGDTPEVLSGHKLYSQVLTYIERSVPSHVAVDILACVAALGHVANDDMPTLATLVGKPLAEVSDLLRRSATNGLLDRSQGAWSLQGALAAPLMASWFFADTPTRPISSLRDAFPNRWDELDRTTLAAAETGAPNALLAADRWANDLPNPTQWPTSVWKLVHTYAGLDYRRSAWATDAAIEVLASDRSRETVLGFALDPTGDAAHAQLRMSARLYLVPEAITALLELSVGDDRPRHSNPDHPVRVLADLAQRLDPDVGTSIAPRQTILRATLDWLGRPPDWNKWDVASEAIAAAFSPQVSGNWLGPADLMTLTVTQGTESSTRLEELTRLWISEVKPVLDRTDAGQIPHCAVANFVELTEQWLRLGVGQLLNSQRATGEQFMAAREGGAVILESLRAHVGSVTGLAYRVNRVLDETERRDISPFQHDRQLEALIGGEDKWEGADYKAHFEEQRERLASVAAELRALGPTKGIARFAELAEQHDFAHGHAPLHLLADQIAEGADDLPAWCGAAIQQSNYLVLNSVLTRMLANPQLQDPSTDLVRAALGDTRLRGAVNSAALSCTEVTPPVEAVLVGLNADDAGILRFTMLRHDTADPVIRRLLNHPMAAIRSTTAVYFAIGDNHGPPLPNDWVAEWRDAVLHTRVEDLPRNDAWRLRRLLAHLVKSDPDLFEQWYTRRLNDGDARYITPPGPHEVEVHLGELPKPHRMRLARIVGGRPRLGESLLTHLVGADADMATTLLDEQAITIEDLLASLLGQRGAMFEVLAPILQAKGVPAEALAEVAASHTRWGFEREEVEAHQEMLAYFESLLRHDKAELREIGSAGIHQQRTRLEAAKARIRDERLRGY